MTVLVYDDTPTGTQYTEMMDTTSVGSVFGESANIFGTTDHD